MSAHFEHLLLIPPYGLNFKRFWNGESEFKSEVQLSSRKSLKTSVFTENPMFMNESVEESFYLWHSDITTAARHYLIWAYTQLSCLLISLHSGLALYDAHIWRSSAWRALGNEVTFERANILWEDEFFTKSQECHRSGAHNGRAAAFGAGDSSGHILGSFQSYFIHNGLGRAEILQSEQIFGKSFVHRSSEEASWENPAELRFEKSTPLSLLPSFPFSENISLETQMLACCQICWITFWQS